MVASNGQKLHSVCELLFPAQPINSDSNQATVTLENGVELELFFRRRHMMLRVKGHISGGIALDAKALVTLLHDKEGLYRAINLGYELQGVETND